MPVSNWSTTAASNGSTLGIDIAENCAAANINNALREMMAQLKTKLDAMDALIGSGSYQPLDTDLTAIAALTSAANKMPYATGSGTWALADLSTFARTFLDDGDAQTVRGTIGALGLTIAGTSSSGSASFTSGASTVFIVNWKEFTATADNTTAVTYHTAYSSWSQAWVNHRNTDTDAAQNSSVVTAQSTTGATVTTAYSASTYTATLFAIGV